ncbi:MAG: hypothetical protein KAW12_29375 [Candidatus Aminicenantes bacterium]|nr:hypothetical protein [Candidatus Aminicenantes bacterium]
MTKESPLFRQAKQAGLDKYFWDHTGNASDAFKLKRLFEYASFPDLLKIPFDFVKTNINEIDASRLRTSKTRIIFITRMKEVIKNCSAWDEIVYKIAAVA